MRIARTPVGRALALTLLALAAVGCGGRVLPSGPSTAPAGDHNGAVGSPPRSVGVDHPLEEGQTLYAVSRAYGVPVSTLVTVNKIDDVTRIPAGTRIFVPGATRRLSIGRARPMLHWPLDGPITAPFRAGNGRGRTHKGLDIDGDSGQTIRAAASGRVTEAGRSGRYGLTVIIDHGDGYSTLYAHASKLLVNRGDRVERGAPIARVGRSGNASGTHLHFEVRRGDRPVDPRPFLR